MDPMIDQVLADIAGAPTLELIAQIWAYCTTHWTDQQVLARLGAACQARDEALRAPPVIAPPVIAPPVIDAPEMTLAEQGLLAVQERKAAEAVQFAGITPASDTPAWMTKTVEGHIGTRPATGQGGAPALDNLRMSLVDLSCSMVDCGIVCPAIDELRGIMTATPRDCHRIAQGLLWAIQQQMPAK